MPNHNQTLTRRAGVEQRPLKGGGAVLVDMNTGRCFKLNRVGAEVWALLGPPLTMKDICSQIAERYHLNVERIRPEIEALTAQLAGEQLISATPATEG